LACFPPQAQQNAQAAAEAAEGSGTTAADAQAPDKKVIFGLHW